MPDVSSPKVDARFWTALCLASICGINLGDFLPDTLRLGAGFAFAVLVGVFVALAVVQAVIKPRAEGLFWLAVLALKAAATVLADYAVNDAHLGFPAVAATLAILLIICVAASGGFAKKEDSIVGHPLFWLMLLLAGALGTAAADWSGSSLFGNPKVGFPATAAIETVLIALSLLVRRAAAGRGWSFWLAVLVICAWGASVGDITKFLLSMPVSLGGSALLLALIVLVWRPAPLAADVRP